jgi:hypothetical protein
MIISLSGRKKSGKTELSKILSKNYNFEILHFADSLKNLMCKLLSVDRTEYEKIKESNINYKISNNDLIYISKILNTDINTLIKLNLNNKEFFNVRDMIQFIGTEIIRNVYPNWHIEQLQKQIDPDKNYCIDDTRFINEFNFVKSINSINWYIIMPTNMNISNHVSETELNWTMFGKNIIINDSKLDILQNKWNNYIQDINNKKSESYNDLIYNFYNNIITNNKAFLDKKDEINNYYISNIINNIELIKNDYEMIVKVKNNNEHFLIELKKFLSLDSFIIKENDYYYITIKNPYIIENLKQWDIFN